MPTCPVVALGPEVTPVTPVYVPAVLDPSAPPAPVNVLIAPMPIGKNTLLNLGFPTVTPGSYLCIRAYLWLSVVAGVLFESVHVTLTTLIGTLALASGSIGPVYKSAGIVIFTVPSALLTGTTLLEAIVTLANTPTTLLLVKLGCPSFALYQLRLFDFLLQMRNL